MQYGCQSMIGKIQLVLLKRPEQAFISQRHLEEHYRAFAYFGCPDYGETIREYDAFEAIVRRYVQDVYYLPADARTGLDSIYAHDPVKVTERGAIYFPMGKKLRAGESYATRDFLESIGVPTLGRIEAPGKMEGGDVLWIDGKTVAIGRGYRTNDEGIAQFKTLTKDFIDEYVIVPMPHGDGEDCCLHLMSVISFVDADKAVVYSRYMPVFFRQYLTDREIRLFECDDEEYAYLGSNLLCLEPGVCLMIDGCPRIKGELEAAGVTVYTYPGKELSWRGTGGPTCLTMPIFRK